MTEIEKKTGMSDTECECLDKYYTENNFDVGQNLLNLGVKPGLAHSTLLLSELDTDVSEYLYSQSKALHKSHIEIINELVREKLTVGV